MEGHLRSIFNAPAIALLLLTLTASSRGSAAELQRFDNLIQLLEKNLYQFDKEAVDRAAVNGLLAELDGQVVVLQAPGGDTGTGAGDSVPSLRKSSLLEDSFVYLQLDSIEAGTDQEIRQALTEAMEETPETSGIILDLRFAEGRAYESVPSVIGLFHKDPSPLFSMKGENYSSRPSGETVDMPMAILVNTETSRAAELAAASFKQIRKAIVIGQKSSGQTFYFEQFNLEGGGTIEVARSPVNMADGTPLSQRGVEPDIAIDAPLDIQRKYLDDPYYRDPEQEAPGRSMTEADLIRLKNQQIAREAGEFEKLQEPGGEAMDQEDDPGTARKTPSAITDPILARGIDFLKGVRFLRQLKGR